MIPTLVLTRPEAQSRAIAAALGADVPVVISPIIEIVGIGAEVDLAGYRGVILTSANALSEVRELDGKRVYCVGERTAEAARAAGGLVVLVAKTADALVAEVEGPGPLLHLRGHHARGAVAERLNLAGIETDEKVVYDQVAQPLSPDAKALFEGESAVVLPLYSPRSAELIATGVSRVGRRVRAIAMSEAVAEAWAQQTGHTAEVCTTPTGAEMCARIAAALRV